MGWTVSILLLWTVLMKEYKRPPAAQRPPVSILLLWTVLMKEL